MATRPGRIAARVVDVAGVVLLVELGLDRHLGATAAAAELADV
jgi:hypothetical protein